MAKTNKELLEVLKHAEKRFLETIVAKGGAAGEIMVQVLDEEDEKLAEVGYKSVQDEPVEVTATENGLVSVKAADYNVDGLA